MKTRLFFIILFVSLAQSGSIYADSVTYPESYSNIAAGNPTKASDVTDAFTAVKSAVDANDGLINANSDAISANTSSITDHETRISTLEASGVTTYNYRDYVAAPTITTMTYQWYRPGAPCNTEVHQFTRTVIDANTTDITLRRTRTDGGSTTCQIRDFVYTQTADTFVYRARNDFDIIGTPVETYTFSEPVIVRTSAMQIGLPIVSTTEVQSTVNSHMIETNTLLGTEAVTVPAGTYTDCIKIHKRRNTAMPGHDLTSIRWYCAGIGLAKAIKVVNGFTGQHFSHSLELVSAN